MFVQIALGSVLMLMSVLIAGLAAWGLEWVYARTQHWLMREPHRPKLMVVILFASAGVMGIMTAGVWIWALAYLWLGIFPTIEEAVYFSLVSFTTLGYGDVLLPPEWGILGGMAAATGLLNIGLLTALLVEALRHVRLGQVEHRRRRAEEAEAAIRARRHH
ncbi:ion channel [Phaeovulum vinaykumarii]|uniref:Ion channel n=1 Tax=Phaeovulum vinaykumarii TaxID=407234 RepID=A0A1N7KT95_9RHOB|nr:ion channel [Phaeovulum vinaykumarii]SIS64767.1 Ion channel [Phaeovulum vinaykumarii]SOC01494.1 ion channel [Phaeovulum vinaykumarii]